MSLWSSLHLASCVLYIYQTDNKGLIVIDFLNQSFNCPYSPTYIYAHPFLTAPCITNSSYIGIKSVHTRSCSLEAGLLVFNTGILANTRPHDHQLHCSELHTKPHPQVGYFLDNTNLDNPVIGIKA